MSIDKTNSRGGRYIGIGKNDAVGLTADGNVIYKMGENDIYLS